MKLSVVSEGVETKKEWEYLRSIECDSVQGYYFYKPMPQDEFMNLLDKTAENSTRLLFHDIPDLDDSILEVFNQTNKKESLLFYSMLGGMGLLEVCGDNVEIIRVNNGYYESVYNCTPREHRVLNVPFAEPERSYILEQCQLAKEEGRMQQFQIHHKLENDTYVWLSIKLRYIGGNSRQAIYLFTVDNIDAQKRAERSQYITKYSSALMKVFDRVYHLNYATDTAEVLHTNTPGYLETNVQYPLSDFFDHFRKICFTEYADTVDALQNKEALDAAFNHNSDPQLTVRYYVPMDGVSVETCAYILKVDTPDNSSHYLCCVKKVH